MSTIRDELETWERTYIRGANVMTRNADAYNHMLEAIQELKNKPWANLVIEKDMQIKSPAEALGTTTGDRT